MNKALQYFAFLCSLMILNPAIMAGPHEPIQSLKYASQSAVQVPGFDKRARDTTGTLDESDIQIVQVSASRTRFIDEYRRYREEVEPRLAELNLEDWAPAELSQILEQVESARKHFQTGDYETAYTRLNNAIMDVDAISAEHESLLDAFLENANRTFREMKFSEASQQITGGLRLDPDHPELTELSFRARIADQVNRLLSEANHARATNQKEQELAILEKILRIDPQHPEARNSMAAIAAENLHQAYTDTVAKADRALDEGSIEEAKKHMQAANRLKPGNQDVQRLQDRVIKVQAEQEYLQKISLAVTAVADDDWLAAAGYYEQALRVKPYDEFAGEGLNDAGAMIGRIESLKQTLKHEERFVNEHSVKATQKLLTETEPFLDLSRGLRELHSEIISKLQIYDMETEVVVTSDNKTRVIVKGVGIVGRILQHTIRLKPGNYQFEGSRDNYKSVIVPVTISPGDGPIEVEVICSERI